MSGGPTYFSNGKIVLCFVCACPKASILIQLLADMLEIMDMQSQVHITMITVLENWKK
jgi:hypothetical protein